MTTTPTRTAGTDPVDAVETVADPVPESLAETGAAAVAPSGAARESTEARRTVASRLVGLDAARGIAVLGMMAVHSLYDTEADGSASLSYLVTGGRSAAIFAVLAGVGVSFTTGRRRVSGARATRKTVAALAVRGLAVAAIGLVVLGWTDAEYASVILPYYGVLFLMAIPLVFLPTPLVAAVAVALAGGAPVLSQLVRPGLPEPGLTNPSLVTLVSDPAGLLSELFFTGYYPALTWITYLAVGVLVGRLDLGSARVARTLALVGAGLAAAAHVVAWFLLTQLGGLARIAAVTAPGDLATAPSVADYVTIYPEGTTPTTTWWWLATDAPHSGTPLDLVQTIGSALAVVGVMLLLGHVRGPRAARLVAAVTSPLAAVGALTLTIYTASVVFLNSPLDDYDAVPGYLLQVVVAVLFAVAWRRAVGRGPLESVVRVLAAAAGRAATRRSREPR